MQEQAWLEYLDALEAYVETAALAIKRAIPARAPKSLASRPCGPLPPKFVERAERLSREIDRLTKIGEARQREIVDLLRIINVRQRIESRHTGRLVDSSL